MWRECEKMKTRIADLQGKITRRQEALLKEFERRGIKSLTDAETGERITYIRAESVVYDKPNLVARLKRSPRGRAVLKRCTVEDVDMRAIAAEVQAGNVSAEIVSASSEIKFAKPYLKSGGGQ